jgi:hypothetical protein
MLSSGMSGKTAFEVVVKRVYYLGIVADVCREIRVAE